MSTGGVTSWTIIREASSGRDDARSEFVQRYHDVIRAYLGHRWRRSALLEHLDDTVQDVFVECFRSGGVLDKVESDRPGGFRAFLFGVVRNVARRVETRIQRNREQPAATGVNELELDDPSQSRAFDQEWARMILREAAVQQATTAAASGAEAERRVELLRRRFEHDVPIRTIAAEWEREPDWLHRQYRLARNEFRDALRVVLSLHHGGAPDHIDAEGDRLLSLFE